MGWCRNADPVASPAKPVEKPADPYETIRVPAFPVLSKQSPELQAFREQCVAGVRQAVAMVTAMEHQLWWERSRRQQAEEDIKVLLAAVHAERGLAGSAITDMQTQLERSRAEATSGQLLIPADRLPEASAAATVIQKNFRGHAARKEFEDHLKTVLRGVDPALNSSMLSASAQHHLSNVNTPAGRQAGLRALLKDAKLVGPEAQHALRQQVETIQRRMTQLPDAGQYTQDPADDPNLDIGRILAGNLPASNAAVIAALVRRCKELQAALVEACDSLQQAHLAESGLRAENMKVLELSQVRIELEEEKGSRSRMQQVVANLRHIITAQAATANGVPGTGPPSINPYVAAWHRREQAGGEFLNWPAAAGQAPGPGAYVFAGPEAEVELWDDLRASLPDPILIPKEATQQYNDLLALRSDLAAGVRPGPPNPLYYNTVPDTSQFRYQRDTPILPVLSPAQMIQESLPPGTYMDNHAMSTGSYQPRQPQQQQPQQLQPPHNAPPPNVPMYSVLPLMREDHAMSHLPSTDPAFQPPYWPPEAVGMLGRPPRASSPSMGGMGGMGGIQDAPMHLQGVQPSGNSLRGQYTAQRLQGPGAFSPAPYSVYSIQPDARSSTYAPNRAGPQQPGMPRSVGFSFAPPTPPPFTQVGSPLSMIREGGTHTTVGQMQMGAPNPLMGEGGMRWTGDQMQVASPISMIREGGMAGRPGSPLRQGNAYPESPSQGNAYQGSSPQGMYGTAPLPQRMYAPPGATSGSPPLNYGTTPSPKYGADLPPNYGTAPPPNHGSASAPSYSSAPQVNRSGSPQDNYVGVPQPSFGSAFFGSQQHAPSPGTPPQQYTQDRGQQYTR